MQCKCKGLRSVGDVGHLSHLHLVGLLDHLSKARVILLQPYDPLTKALDLLRAAIVVSLQRLLVDDAGLLSELLVLLLEDLALLLHLGE